MLSSYITKSEDVCAGRARLDGHRIRVQDIACYSEWWGWGADQIASELDITLAQVHSALAYYFDNIEEIRSDIQLELDAYEIAKTAHSSKLSEKLNARTSIQNPKSA